jgi:hypothetical protein
MSQYPEVLQPLLFYILHRANALITDRQIATTFKAFFIDEAWVFLKNPSIQRYVVEALKTWRKHNAAMVLSTQSIDELRRSDILDVIIESCATKIFLANPEMDRDLYRTSISSCCGARCCFAEYCQCCSFSCLCTVSRSVPIPFAKIFRQQPNLRRKSMKCLANLVLVIGISLAVLCITAAAVPGLTRELRLGGRAPPSINGPS